MTKFEFMEQLKKELTKNNIADVSDIISEYEQHFTFKLADGFSEEEIAANLGSPIQIAAQFCAEDDKARPQKNKWAVTAGLCLADVVAGMLIILLIAWGIILAAFSLCSLALAVSLILGIYPWSQIIPMPLGINIIFSIALAALSILSAVGTIYYSAFVRRLIRAYGRFHHNSLAAALGKPVLPALSVYPNFQQKTKRCLRRITLISLSIFAAFIILAIIVSMICSGSIEFWHTWGWFGYTM